MTEQTAEKERLVLPEAPCALPCGLIGHDRTCDMFVLASPLTQRAVVEHPHTLQEEGLQVYRVTSQLTALKPPGQILKPWMPGALPRDSRFTGLGQCPGSGMLQSSLCRYNVNLGSWTIGLGQKQLVQGDNVLK